MVDWTSGLLGGIKGAGEAVGDISRDQRKELAEHLKLQALDAMQGRRDTRLHGQAKEIQDVDIKAKVDIQRNDIQMRKDLSKEEKDAAMARLDKVIASEEGKLGQQITSREKIAGEQNTSQEKIAGDRNATIMGIAEMERDLKRELSSVEKDTAKAANLRTKVDATKEARKALREGQTLDEANVILDAAGLPRLEEYVKDPGKSGWFVKDVPPTMGIRQQGLIPTGVKPDEKPGAGATTTAQSPAKATSSAKSDLDRLLEEGKKTMPAKGGIVGEAMADTPTGENTTGTGEKGVLGRIGEHISSPERGGAFAVFMRKFKEFMNQPSRPLYETLKEMTTEMSPEDAKEALKKLDEAVSSSPALYPPEYKNLAGYGK